MTVEVFRFTWPQGTPLQEAEMTLQLSIFAAEGLYGAARVRLETGYLVDEPRRTILIDGSSEVGSVVVRVFTNLLLREFGENSFQVCRAESHPVLWKEERAV